jgi:hypothetical protein
MNTMLLTYVDNSMKSLLIGLLNIHGRRSKMAKVVATSYASDGVKETYIHHFISDGEAKAYVLALKELSNLHEAYLHVKVDGKEV